MRIPTILLSISFFFQVFGQQESIKAMQDAHDKTARSESTVKSEHFSPSLFVDPFIGTGGHGHTFPGATAPFGMMQLSPDTRIEGWDGCGGYHYEDSVIYGFSHTHLNGTGVPDYCDLLLVPQCGEPKTKSAFQDVANGYGDVFSHMEEEASPGYYRVKLKNQGIDVQLTTGIRSGMHVYTFERKKGKKYVLIDLDHRDKLLKSQLEKVGKNAVQGMRISQSWANEQHFYFYLETSVPIKNSQTIQRDNQHKLLLEFPEKCEKIMVRVGISAVDIEGAKQNLRSEITDWNFHALRAKTTKNWNLELSKIRFSSTDSEVMKKFYTGLYHCFLQPNVFSDADGRYRGRDNQIHRIENGREQYTVFSLWDTYRAAHPLYTIVQQKRTDAFLETFLRQFDQGGDLPVWELAGNETECMIGYHSVSVIADAWLKGIRGIDGKKALHAMTTTAAFREFGKELYRKNGFLSSGDEPESVSKTLEYAYDDFCIAQMAEALGEKSIQQAFTRSSFGFSHLYDPATKFMRARRGALWHAPFDPSEVNFNFTEANSWQYSLYAPHAISVLSEWLGGKDSLENWLDRLFQANAELSGRHQVDITGLIGQYAHGNEPSHHMAYLYNYTKSPYKTQETIDRIQQEMYTAKPDGLSGNEDCGQMSAWYVLSSLGFYQVAPGNPVYDIGRPLMDEAEIQLENGKKLNIRTVHNSPDNKYLQRITINGMEHNLTTLHHNQIMAGGNWVFEMGPKPNKDVFASTSKSAFDTSTMRSSGFVPVPFFTTENRIFDDSLLISIASHPSLLKERTELQYRFADDTNNVLTYLAPFYIKATRKLDIRRRNSIAHPTNQGAEIQHYSPWISGEFIKRDPNVLLTLKSEYSPQYAASGPNTLVDGIYGGAEFRTGEFQGFWAQDVVSEVTFVKPKKLTEIGLSCIQDMKSWIFFPSEIQMEISTDGEHFQALKTIYTNVPFASNTVTQEMIPSFSTYVGPMHRQFFRTIDSPVEIKKLRITAKNFGKCPDWHLGFGNDTWLFIDELIMR
jgi:predicted alpha-1,2-mannosidase